MGGDRGRAGDRVRPRGARRRPAGGLEVHGLYVDPEAQGAGAGRALLRAAVGDARARGARDVVLWHFVGNDRAARFYERFGFRLDGARRPSDHGADEVRRSFAR